MGKKELQAKQQNAVALPTEAAEWGLDEAVDTQDILIPKLLVMQGLSKAVADEKAQMGEFIDSLTYEILGSAREKDPKPVEFIPLTMFKTWIRYEKIGDDKLDFRGIHPVTPENADWKWEETDEDGNHFRNDQCLNFYVILKEKADDPMEMPYLLTFRRTSYKNGKKLATHFAKCQRALQLNKVVPPASNTFKLTAVKTTNDEGTFYVMDIEPGGKTSKEHIQVAKDWVATIKQSNVKVDNSDIVGDESEKTEAVDVDNSEF